MTLFPFSHPMQLKPGSPTPKTQNNNYILYCRLVASYLPPGGASILGKIPEFPALTKSFSFSQSFIWSISIIMQFIMITIIRLLHSTIFSNTLQCNQIVVTLRPSKSPISNLNMNCSYFSPIHFHSQRNSIITSL